MTSHRKSRGGGKPGGGFGFSIAGDRKRKRLAEYPCVSRLRQRRLLLFLISHEFFETHKAFMGETAVLMNVLHLQDLVLHGQWSDAVDYLSRFLPSDHPLGVNGRALLHFLRLHKAIDDIVAGDREARSVIAAVTICSTDRIVTRSPALSKLRATLSSLVESKTLRDSLDLACVRCEASSIIHDLVYRTPELKDHMRLCRGSTNPQNVLPLGFGHGSFRPRRHIKKQGGQVPAPVVAAIYLQKKKALTSSSSSDHSKGLTREALVKAKEWLVDLVDRCVEAGKPHQRDPVRAACSKGAPGPQTTFCTVPRLGGKSRVRLLTSLVILRETNEWLSYLTEECLEAWPDASKLYPLQYLSKPGAFAARLSKPVPGAFTRPAESSLISSNAEAGALAARLSETMPDNFTRHAEKSVISPVSKAGAPPRVSQILSDTLTMPAEYSVDSSVTNAGAPFAHASENSGISSVTNDGSVLWQNMSGICTDHSKKSAISFRTNSGIAEFNRKLNIST